MRQVFAPAAFLPQNLRNSAAVLLFFQDLCGNLCTVAAGIHGGLFNHAVGFRFAHALVLDQIALGAVHQPDLGNLIPQFVVFLPQIIQAAAAGGGHLNGWRNCTPVKALPTPTHRAAAIYRKSGLRCPPWQAE